MFGVVEGAVFAMAGLGALLATAVIGALGVRIALLAAGAVLPLCVALTWRHLRGLDAAAEAPSQRVALLRHVPIFRPLPAPELEGLAKHLEPVRAAAGEVIIREGDPGERFFLIVEGSVEVSVNGRVLEQLGTGEGFGGIALLRDVPRTATVTARGAVGLLALDREAFLAAVASHPMSGVAADSVIASRLARGGARLLVP